MKKLIKIIFVTLILISSHVFAQGMLSGIKIAVDPGHGGHDPANDRYIEATGFWESDGNWAKANHLKEILESYGATVILTKTSSLSDPSLSARDEIANANNVDFFNSIHSNGWQGQRNSTLMLFRGYDNDPVFPQAKEMSNIMVDEIYKTNRTTGKSVRGDWSFYPDWGYQVGLGVLRHLNMPGVLSEGSFHDYIPESWRLLNDAYKRHEAWAIARSYLDLYNAGTDPTGILAGIVRNPDVNVSYYYIPGTNDQKKPVNNVKVRIVPGNLEYNGDNNNNGFFFFEGLLPGEYKVYYETDEYAKDSSTVTVSANSTVFADKYVIIPPNYDPPHIISSLPGDSSKDVSLLADISIAFDNRMNQAATENALTIEPAVEGSFTWDDLWKTVTFTPDNNFEPGVTYNVTIDTTAKTVVGVNLENELSYSFSTREKLNLLFAYPEAGADDISTTVKLNYWFDAPIRSNTLAANIAFYDEQNNPVQVLVENNLYSEGKIVFEPQTPLEYNKTYTVELGEGIGDTEGLSFGENQIISFTTTDSTATSGYVFENFEDIGGWKDPEYSGSTIGIDPDKTTFTITYERSISGNSSGQIKYAFTGTDGVCRVYDSDRPVVGAIDSSVVEAWVFGDISSNELEYWFFYNDTINAVVNLGPIDWTGWKLMPVKIADIPGSGERLFHSIVIRQTEDGALSGEVYVDDFSSDVVTSVDENEILNSNIPGEFVLSQNYPNPFNPSTNIRFRVPEKSFVSLKVYNILGKEVADLVNEEMNKGTYNVKFDAGDLNLSSGMYIYKLSAGSFIQTKKMMLLK